MQWATGKDFLTTGATQYRCGRRGPWTGVCCEATWGVVLRFCITGSEEVDDGALRLRLAVFLWIAESALAVSGLGRPVLVSSR